MRSILSNVINARSRPYIHWLSLFTTLSTYGLIVLGGVVRATDSGLACPDWPRCHGELIPAMDTNIMIEYSHRLTAMGVGILIISLAISILIWRRNDRPLLVMGLLSVALVIIQALIGALTVDTELSSGVVALHLSMALTLFAVLIFMTVLTLRSSAQKENASQKIFKFNRRIISWINTWAGRRFFIVALSILALIIVGSFVSNEGAALVYSDWPLFNSKLSSSGGYLADLHYAHRIMAALIGLGFLVLTLQIWRNSKSCLVRYAFTLAMLLYVAQVFVGASNIWLALATPARISHLALASAIWGLLLLSISWHYLRPANKNSEL